MVNKSHMDRPITALDLTLSDVEMSNIRAYFKFYTWTIGPWPFMYCLTKVVVAMAIGILRRCSILPIYFHGS